MILADVVVSKTLQFVRPARLRSKHTEKKASDNSIAMTIWDTRRRLLRSNFNDIL